MWKIFQNVGRPCTIIIFLIMSVGGNKTWGLLNKKSVVYEDADSRPIFCPIDLLAIIQKSLDRATFLYNFIREIRLSGVRASIAILHIRKFYKM